MMSGSGVVATSLGGIAAAIVIVGLGLSVLNVVATRAIITKAGYSGWWILVVFVPVVTWIGSVVYLDRSVYSPFDSTTSAGFDARTLVALWIIDGIGFVLPWIFFLVFAFSDWPVQRQLRERFPQTAGRGGRPIAPPLTEGALQMPVAPSPVHNTEWAGPAFSFAPGPSGVPGASDSSRPMAPPLSFDFVPAPMSAPPAPPESPTAAPLVAPWTCPQCGAPTRRGSPFCGSCGARLTPQPSGPLATDGRPSARGEAVRSGGADDVVRGTHCRNCLAANRDGARYCSNCGVGLQGPSV